MTDSETIRVYDSRAADYAALTDEQAGNDPSLAAFIGACPKGGRVLDLGCGPGTSAAAMAQSGLLADALDASAEMVALAGQRAGVNARRATFDQIEGTGVYDGIWANFSLLHAPRADMPRHLAALKQALKPGGVFHIGMKLGEGEARDGIGRLYTYYSEDELVQLLEQTGFDVKTRKFGEAEGLDGTMAPFILVTAHG
ncbi:class I SAM-dependent methyltransferase [Leisingera sp. M523]|uniref:class I SAM-dependent DNA methyltransferase n=1 Tax=Leisingera sp. M523 TaxID=2867013 RepID=UPI0021A5EA7A|nr:class I SAM-dependent methyltransferase [Leisingera sp. M523]UWQ28454.1 class I SAM-dependent methyltransferase [Leisingera sp. M523]